MVKIKKNFYIRRRNASEKKMGPANVLAFPETPHFVHPREQGVFLGEIFLNRTLTKDGADELTRLLIHGLLHLLGYRHNRKRDILTMERLERRLEKRVIQKNKAR